MATAAYDQTGWNELDEFASEMSTIWTGIIPKMNHALLRQEVNGMIERNKFTTMLASPIPPTMNQAIISKQLVFLNAKYVQVDASSNATDNGLELVGAVTHLHFQLKRMVRYCNKSISSGVTQSQ